jgi:hypothetical protein
MALVRFTKMDYGTRLMRPWRTRANAARLVFLVNQVLLNILAGKDREAMV